MSSGRFIIGANHIGNVIDIPARVLEAIETIDIVLTEYRNIFIEDMIYLKKNNKKEIMEYEDSDEFHIKIIDILNDNKNILFLVQHGYPGTADFGTKLINKLIRQGHNVEIIPGPSIVPTAIAISGIISDEDGYTFKSFFNDDEKTILKKIEKLKDIPHTLVLIDKSPKTKKMLEIMLNVFGDRDIALCLNIGDRNDLRYRHQQEIFIGSISSTIEKIEELRYDILATVVCKGKSLI